jgi:hypothetical protein
VVRTTTTRKGKIPKIVATFVYASSQGQRTNSARNKIEQPQGDHLRVLRKKTRRKVTQFSFRPVSMEYIVKKIRDITSKPSYSMCGISFKVLHKLKDIVKKTIMHDASTEHQSD